MTVLYSIPIVRSVFHLVILVLRLPFGVNLILVSIEINAKIAN